MKRGGMMPGMVSLMMFFCVLCLAIFSVLALATADREHRLTSLTAERAEAWYEADRKAMGIAGRIRNGEMPEEVSFTDTPEGQLAEFSVPAGGDQNLSAAILVTPDEFRIIRWQTVFEGEWEADMSIDVWDGDWGFWDGE